MKKVNYKNKILETIAAGVLVLSTFSTSINTFANGSGNTSTNKELSVLNSTTNVLPTTNSLSSKRIEESKPKKNSQPNEKKVIAACGLIQNGLAILTEELSMSKEKVIEEIQKACKQKHDVSNQTHPDLTENLSKLLQNKSQKIDQTIEDGTTVSLSLHVSGLFGIGGTTLVINCNKKNCELYLDGKFLQTLANNKITYIVSESHVTFEEGYRWNSLHETSSWSLSFHTSFPNALTPLGSQQPQNYYHYQTEYSINS